MTIYLQNEFGSTWPLWRSEGCQGRTPMEDRAISATLRARLDRWNAFFHEHYSWEHGWADAEDEHAHRIEGQQLLLLLREELGDTAVELRLWECRSTDLSAL